MPARRAFESLIEELTGDRALRRLAIDGVLERLNADRERYSREEVEEGLEDPAARCPVPRVRRPRRPVGRRRGRGEED